MKIYGIPEIHRIHENSWKSEVTEFMKSQDSWKFVEFMKFTWLMEFTWFMEFMEFRKIHENREHSGEQWQIHPIHPPPANNERDFKKLRLKWSIFSMKRKRISHNLSNTQRHTISIMRNKLMYLPSDNGKGFFVISPNTYNQLASANWL